MKSKQVNGTQFAIEISGDRRAYLELVAEYAEVTFEQVISVIVADHILRREIKEHASGRSKA